MDKQTEEKIDLKKEVVMYVVGLMKTPDGSPEMVAAIARLLELIVN